MQRDKDPINGEAVFSAALTRTTGPLPLLVYVGTTREDRVLLRNDRKTVDAKRSRVSRVLVGTFSSTDVSMVVFNDTVVNRLYSSHKPGLCRPRPRFVTRNTARVAALRNRGFPADPTATFSGDADRTPIPVEDFGT